MATIMTLDVEKMKKGSAADGFGSSSGGGLLGLLDSMLMKEKIKKKKKAAYKASDQEDSDSDENEDNHHKREADILFDAIMKDLFGLSVMSEQEREKKKKPPPVKDNIPSRGRKGVSIKEDDEGMTVKVKMPGLGKENVKVSVVDYTLLIKEDENENENGKKKKNKKWGMHLPDEYKYEEIKAIMKNGILTVVIPKKKEEERKEDGIHVVVED